MSPLAGRHRTAYATFYAPCTQKTTDTITTGSAGNRHTQPFNGLWSGTTRVGQYQKKHSPTHTHPDHRTSFIIFLHSSTPSLRIAQLITSLRTLSEAFSKFSAGNSMHEIFQLLHQLFVTTGCLQMQPNQFSRDFQDIFF